VLTWGRIRQIRQSGLARETSWALAGELLTIVVLTLSFTLLGRRLGPEGYGAFVGLYGLLGPAISINQSAVGLTIYEHIVRRGESADRVGGSCLSSTLAIGVVLAGVVVGLGTILLPSLPIVILVLFALSELIVTSVLMLAIAVVQAVRSFTAATQLRILATTLRGVMIVVLALVDALTLRNLALGQAVTAALALVVVGTQLRRHHGRVIGFARIRWDTMKSIGTYSAGISATSVQLGGDKVVLNSARHVSDAGLYGAAYRLILLAQVPATALQHSTHLRFLDREVRDPLRLCVRYSALAAGYGLVATIAAWVLAPLLPVLLGSEFEGTTSVVRWLSPLIVLGAMSPFPANGLLTYGRNALRTKLAAANAVLALGLYVALIPPHSWRGAVAASIIAELVLVVTTWTALLLVRRQQQRSTDPAAVVDHEPVGVAQPGVSEPRVEFEQPDR
jgi:O-antigen/teichoic acid export membrane protein